MWANSSLWWTSLLELARKGITNLGWHQLCCFANTSLDNGPLALWTNFSLVIYDVIALSAAKYSHTMCARKVSAIDWRFSMKRRLRRQLYIRRLSVDGCFAANCDNLLDTQVGNNIFLAELFTLDIRANDWNRRLMFVVRINGTESYFSVVETQKMG